jgi:KDO2-lipid IV(A) lauroyltransferase
LGSTYLGRSLEGTLTLTALKVGAPVVGRFPRLGYALARAAGWAVWRLRGNARARLEENLLPACDGDRKRAREASRRAFRYAANYHVDLATLAYRDHSRYEREHLVVMGEEHVPALFEPGPVLVASAHTGNPELALIAVKERGRRWVELVEALQPPALGREMTRLRELAGGRVVEVDMAGTREALRELRAGGMVTLLADRDLGGGGVCTTLLGRRVRLPRGPWELARRSGATVVPLFFSRRGTHDQTVWFEKPFTVPPEGDREEAIGAAAQRWADLFGAHLRRDPGQWTVLEDYWKVHACG